MKAAAAVLASVLCAPPAHARLGAESLLEDFRRASPAEKPLLALALGARGKPKAVPELSQALAGWEGDPVLAAAAARALGQLGPTAEEPLLRVWRETSADERAGALRAEVVRALGRAGGPRGAVTVREGVVDRDPVVAAASLETVGRLKDAGALDAVLLQCASPNPRLARAAMEAVGALRDPRAEPALRAALTAEREPLAAAYALRRLGRFDGAETLEKAAAGPTGEDSLEAARYLLMLGKSSGFRVLTRALEEGSGAQEQAAATLLGSCGDARAAVPLARALGSAYLPLRLAAARALGELGGDRARYELAQRGKDPDPGVRAAVRESRARLGDYEAP
ncbi:MAG TPA: HEAT repeat domain-containing protein [Elusimicrobiota bacterium]|nr:HEAT repeat domain-containing protein [Elusimicrobiota bacterium]